MTQTQLVDYVGDVATKDTGLVGKVGAAKRLVDANQVEHDRPVDVPNAGASRCLDTAYYPALWSHVTRG